MKVSIKEKVKIYLKSKRRWVSHQELEKQADNFGCCSSSIMRKARELYQFDPHIDRKLINGIVYYKYCKF